MNDATRSGRYPFLFAALSRLAWIILWLGLAAAALWPMLSAPQLYSVYYDWRYFDTVAEIARRTVLWYHQVPLWNPYSCGGEVDLANPQSMQAAPTFLLVLLFGTALGTKLALLVYYALALDGAYRLARHFGCRTQGALLAACGYGLSGYLSMHLSVGHINFAGVALYPYLLLFYERALQVGRRHYIVPLAFVAAWIAVLGGTFTPPMAGILLVLFACMRALTGVLSLRSARASENAAGPDLTTKQQGAAISAKKRLKTMGWAIAHPFLVLGAAGLLALCFGAARMLPALEFIYDHPRPLFRRTWDSLPPQQVLLGLIKWRRYGAMPGYKYFAHEYSARLPWALLPLWLGSLRLLFRPDQNRGCELSALSSQTVRCLWLLALCAAVLAMGNWQVLNINNIQYKVFLPWQLLQMLPVLRDLRVPSRFLVLVVLPLSVLAGLMWEALRPRLGRLQTPIFGLLLFVTAVDGVWYSASLWRGQFQVQMQAPAQPVPFYFIFGQWQTMRADVFAGHGTLHCDEEAPLQRADKLDVGDVPQARLQEAEAGQVLSHRFSPNERVMQVVLKRGTVLLINSNWNEHWRARISGPAGSSVNAVPILKIAGQLAVDLRALPPGEYLIAATYAPKSFAVGLWLSLLSLLFGLFWFLHRYFNIQARR